MKLRGWTILWTTLGVAAAGVACVWVLVHFNLLPLQSEIWMDLYTGNLRLRKTCAGITLKVSPWRNFSSGYAPGANLSSYKDPEGREEWIKVAEADFREDPDPYLLGTSGVVISWPCLSQLMMVSRSISGDPRPGFKYDPPNGYSKRAKRLILLNSLQIARETGNAMLIKQYYDFTVDSVRSLEHRAYDHDLPDVDEFLAAHKTGSGH